MNKRLFIKSLILFVFLFTVSNNILYAAIEFGYSYSKEILIGKYISLILLIFAIIFIIDVIYSKIKKKTYKKQLIVAIIFILTTVAIPVNLENSSSGGINPTYTKSYKNIYNIAIWKK